MTWQESVDLAERALSAATVPRSEELVSLIKKVNPTKLSLPEEKEAQGYLLKARLQSLLLENYGDSFYFVIAEFDDDIVLIKHRFLPSVDACHARLSSLSHNACESAWEQSAPVQQSPKVRGEKGNRKRAVNDDQGDVFMRAQSFVEEYDFAAAAETLALLGDAASPSTVVKGARLLIEECGYFEAAIKLLLAQQRQTLKDPRLRELLALAYHKNGFISEARAVLETATFCDLGKEALYAWADIAHGDGNDQLAWYLLKKAEEKDGFVTTGLTKLGAEVEAALRAEAEPLLQRAQEAFERDDLPGARLLAKEALEHYPTFAAAGALISVIDNMAAQDERSKLWGAAEVATGSARIAALERLQSLFKEDADRVRPLLQAEKALLKQAELSGRIANLSVLAHAGKWGEAYEVISELSRRQDFADHSDHIAGLSPFFAALLASRRLSSLAAPRAREVWLAFVAFMTGEGSPDVDRLEELRRYFGDADGFEERYQAAVALAQEQARRRIAALIAALGADGCDSAVAARTASRIRKFLPVLPPEERSPIVETVEGHLERLAPPPSAADPLEEYRAALLIGDSVRAGMARELVGGDAATVIDREITDYLAIVSEPLSVELLSEEEVDLKDGQDMKVIGRCGDVVLLRENNNSIILVDTDEDRFCATRYTSHHFAGLTLSDAFPSRGTYLFSDERTAWRARLAEAGSCFLGTFDIADRFQLAGNERPCRVFLSKERPGEQYLHSMVENADGQVESRMVRTDTFRRLTRNASQTVKNARPLECYRLSLDRDRFLLASEQELKVLDRSLCQACCNHEGGAVVGVCTSMEQIHVINVETQQVMVQDAANAFSPRSLFRFRNKLPRPVYDPSATWIPAGSNAFFITKDSTKGIFYDYDADRSTGTLTGIICTDTIGVTFAYRYDAAKAVFKMRCIGFSLDKHVAWKEGGPDLQPLRADQMFRNGW